MRPWPRGTQRGTSDELAHESSGILHLEELARRVAQERRDHALLPVAGHTFMLAVGVIEIAAGILVAVSPEIGGYVVACWLWGIIANLLMIPGFYDIALRDFGLSLGAFALARLAAEFDQPMTGEVATNRI